MESLSTYARQFLGTMNRPAVDHIDGLSPAIAIDQKSASGNPRSTVATVTEIHDFLRVLYARTGQPYCPRCNIPVNAATPQQIVDNITALGEAKRVILMAPRIRELGEKWVQVLREARRGGFARIRLDSEIVRLDQPIDLDESAEYTIDIVVDRVQTGAGSLSRLADSVETALALGKGVVIVQEVDGEEHRFSTRYACPECELAIPELTPQLFSFNSPHGMCERCDGLGYVRDINPELFVADGTRSILDGALQPYGDVTNPHLRHILDGLAAGYGFDLSTPWNDLPEEVRTVILHGSGGDKISFSYETSRGRHVEYAKEFEGLANAGKRRYKDSRSNGEKHYLERYVADLPCPACGGRRLRPEALAVRFEGKTIADIAAMDVTAALSFFAAVKLDKTRSVIARELLKEISSRLRFMTDVGVGYLSLDRPAPSLSGGEAQRIRLATQMGSGLAGILYILDEPSIGLHPRDQEKLLAALFNLRDLGNTVIVVEHDSATIEAADHVVEFGPGAGIRGGELIFSGTVADMKASDVSLTGRYLAGKLAIPTPGYRRTCKDAVLDVRRAAAHNLKSVDVQIPLGCFVCVTGVSGSGKSTLVHDVIYRSLKRHLHNSTEPPGAHESIIGLEHVDKIINIDQNPIGRTPRSNPATYVQIFGPIRDLFAATPEAQVRGYKPGRFSFNVRGGRCEACQGDGTVRVEMHFLPPVYVPCEQCGGSRYNRETLQVRYKGKSIAQVLDLTVAEALELFENVPHIERVLRTLYEVGLDYIKLGQPAPTLSGGEAQRLKLARELAKIGTGRTLYVLDEPTTGLHFADIEKLLAVLERLVDAGNTVLVIEHNLDVVKCADYVIDLGPEGGSGGGMVVAAGTPEEVAKKQQSYTGRYLKTVL